MVCLLRKDDKFCQTFSRQPKCINIKLVRKFSTEFHNGLLFRNFDIISVKYNGSMVGFGELRTDLVTCFRDLDNICEQLSNFGKGAFVGF